MPARKKTRRPAKKASPPAKKKRGAVARGRATSTPAGGAARRATKMPARRSARLAAPAAVAPAAAAPPPPANDIGFITQHLDYTTHDIDAMRRFYVDTLGFVDSDHDPGFNYLRVRTGSSSSLGFMPPMPGIGMPSPVKEPTLYFLVEDVDRAYAELCLKGVHFEGPPADMPWGHRVVSTLDPEGRRVVLATPNRTNA